MRKIIYISPSNLSFLAEECQRCYYLETHGIRRRPRAPMPTIFTKIDHAMKQHLGQGVHVLDATLPAFTVISQDRRVSSRPIHILGTNVDLIIRGIYDSLVHFADGTVGVVDWKTSRVKDDLVAKYSRSLHAYALALEFPLSGPMQTVNRLGLGVFDPSSFTGSRGSAQLDGSLTWVPILRDDAAFAQHIQGLGRMLAALAPPVPKPSCLFCSYGEAA